jgi:crossover junction endodeoxyribonuclease RusA
MKITLPWPPTVNTYYSVVKGRKILSKKGREYRLAVLRALIITRFPVGEPLHGDLDIEMYLFPPDARKRDIDNYLKAPLDALTKAGLWGDDSQIKRLDIKMESKDKFGRVELYCMSTEAGKLRDALKRHYDL